MQFPAAREWCITAAASPTCLCQTAAERQQQQTNPAWSAQHFPYRGPATCPTSQQPSSTIMSKLIRCCTPLPTAAVLLLWSRITCETLKVWQAAVVHLPQHTILLSACRLQVRSACIWALDTRACLCSMLGTSFCAACWYHAARLMQWVVCT